jgi:hypothetical protein
MTEKSLKEAAARRDKAMLKLLKLNASEAVKRGKATDTQTLTAFAMGGTSSWNKNFDTRPLARLGWTVLHHMDKLALAYRIAENSFIPIFVVSNDKRADELCKILKKYMFPFVRLSGDLAETVYRAGSNL